MQFTMSNKKALHRLIIFYLAEKSLELEPYSFFRTCTKERTILSLSAYSCLYVQYKSISQFSFQGVIQVNFGKKNETSNKKSQGQY